jgi:hypothetical protein
MRAAKDFLMAYDKGKTGLISQANFMKIARVFGIQVNQIPIKANEVGMIEYDKVLESIMNV